MAGERRIGVPNGGVRMLEGSTEVVLHRDGQLQVELITIRRGLAVPSHTHPNVESYEVPLAAGQDTYAVVMGKQFHGGGIVPLRRDEPHHAVTGADADLAFLSFQYWYDDVAPTFITDDWVGPQWR